MSYLVNLSASPARRRRVLAAVVAGCCVSVVPSATLGNIAAPGLVKDINAGIVGQPDAQANDPTAEGPNFIGSVVPSGADPATGVNIFASGAGAPYQADQLGEQNGNQVLVITQDGVSANDGAGFTYSVSNGENGDGLSGYETFPGDGFLGTDPSNDVGVDPAISALGTGSGRLEAGNVVRFSVWLQRDPLAPITVEPQIAPLVKLEFWRDSLSTAADFNSGGQPNNSFGSRLFDTDQNGVAVGAAERARVVDIDGDGQWSFGAATDTLGAAGVWTQVVHTIELQDVGQFDILDSVTVEGISDIEEVRGVLFLGDFAGNNLGGPGNLLVDNALIEFFPNAAAEAASDVMVSNPTPALDEMTAIPGDFDMDGDVDTDDFGVFVNSFQNSPQGGPPFAPGDFDEDGDVDTDDFGVFVNSFQNFPPTPGVAVPEPTSAALLACLMLAGGLRRRG